MVLKNSLCAPAPLREKNKFQQQAAVNSLLALFTLGLVGGFFFIGRRHDIRCPKCDRSIQGGVYASLAIATGKCGHCGEVIVDE
jgi:hypothetical protein